MAKVLVCDDSRYIRSTISKILTEIGHEVVGEADNGEDVLVKYFNLRPDIVTMDVIMPKKHGIDALRELMQNDPNARVIIVSAVTHEPLIKKGLELGALSFLTKPFTANEFISGFSMVG